MVTSPPAHDAEPLASSDWRNGLRRCVQPTKRLSVDPPTNLSTTTFATGKHTFNMVLPVATARRRDSALREASGEVARRRARRLASDTTEGAIGAPLPFLEEIFMAADDLAEYGVNYNTNTKDAHAFDQWITFCEMFETEPLRTARMARDDPEREQHLLSLFALWAYPRLKPRSREARWAKPAFALAYPLAIIRIFSRWGVHLPKISGDGNVTVVIGGRTLTDPTEEQWRGMGAGDYIVVTPPRSKTDQFGEIHCPYPCILPFENTPLNAARRLREAALCANHATAKLVVPRRSLRTTAVSRSVTRTSIRY